MGKIIVCAADEVLNILEEKKIVAVLSIEHPDVVETNPGYAPRLSDVTQKILCFWDSEQAVHRGPDIEQIEKGIMFALTHLDAGDVIIHCKAGKSRSTALALGVLALQNPNKNEATLIGELLALRPVAAPNIIVIEMVDALAGRGGNLLQAVLDHPVLTQQREAAEKLRQAAIAKNPKLAKKLFPEKFPKP